MSKWKLLGAVIRGEANAAHSSSIHRFEGFQLLKSKRLIFPGFCLCDELTLDATTLDEETIPDLVLRCCKFMERIDCAEFKLILSFSGYTQQQCLDLLSLLYQSSETTQSGEAEICLTFEATDDFEVEASRQSIRVRGTYEPIFKVVQFKSYPLSGDAAKCVYTRERPKEHNVSIGGLLSNKMHGIDNTGNVCVWASEPLLLHHFLVNGDYLNSFRDKRILELGGGMAGLCGLGIAASVPCTMILTDGHPDCVANQRVCTQMTYQSLTSQESEVVLDVSCHLLRWSIEDATGDLAAIMGSTYEHTFDVIVVADCLFFKEFHLELISTLRRALSSDGMAYLLQPRRSGTLEKFVELASPHFDIEVHDSYSEEVDTLHEAYLAGSPENGYDQDVHCPVLLQVTHKAV